MDVRRVRARVHARVCEGASLSMHMQSLSECARARGGRVRVGIYAHVYMHAGDGGCARVLEKNKTRPHFVAASKRFELQKLAHQEQSAWGFVFSSLKVRITDGSLWRTRIDEFSSGQRKNTNNFKKNPSKEIKGVSIFTEDNPSR